MCMCHLCMCLELLCVFVTRVHACMYLLWSVCSLCEQVCLYVYLLLLCVCVCVCVYVCVHVCYFIRCVVLLCV